MTKSEQAKAVDINMGVAIAGLIDLLKANKPNDRSPRDRHYQVAITDLEKVVAYFAYYVASVKEVKGAAGDQ